MKLNSSLLFTSGISFMSTSPMFKRMNSLSYIDFSINFVSNFINNHNKKLISDTRGNIIFIQLLCSTVIIRLSQSNYLPRDYQSKYNIFYQICKMSNDIYLIKSMLTCLDFPVFARFYCGKRLPQGFVVSI